MWPYNLTRHIKYKHGQKHNQLEEYSCTLCSKQYQWPHDLTRHLKIKHNQYKQRHNVHQQPKENHSLNHLQQQQQQQQEDYYTQNMQQQQQQQQDHHTQQIQQQQQHQQVTQNKQQPQTQELLRQQVINTNKVLQQQQHGSTTYPENLMNHDYPIPKYMVFKHPFTMLISGPSGCGKTFFVRKLLRFSEQMIDQHLQDIIWCHGIEQPFHHELKNEFPMIKFNNGLPDPAILSRSKPQLMVLDDLMNETKGNIVANLFAKWSHHTNTSVIYITQNLFPKNKENRDISLNSKYIVVFKNPRDGQQITFLGTLMGKQKFISEAFQVATVKPHGYLMLDLTQDAKDELRTRSQIFPDDQVNILFLPSFRNK